MLIKVFGAAVQGIDATLITIEVNSSRGCMFYLVGLPDSAVKESHQRIISALLVNGYKMPTSNIVVNMAPADIRKEGSAYDLPLAIGLLGANETISSEKFSRYLFMGDAEEKAEEDMIKENYDLECDVLKVGHHGSYTATGDNFLTKADPAYAVISAGKDNSYGHPHAATLAKLEDDDVQIYRTDTMGTIEAVSDGNQIQLETEKGITNE